MGSKAPAPRFTFIWTTLEGQIQRTYTGTYYFDGKYYPATMETPEEHPEIIIETVILDGVEIDETPDGLEDFLYDNHDTFDMIDTLLRHPDFIKRAGLVDVTKLEQVKYYITNFSTKDIKQMYSSIRQDGDDF